jgi:hypothetical protein
MLLTIEKETIIEINPSKTETPTPQRAAFPAEFAFLGDLSLSVKYKIKPTIGIKNDIMFRPVEGTSLEFKIPSLEVDSL